jgi:hypothetical protein
MSANTNTMADFNTRAACEELPHPSLHNLLVTLSKVFLKIWLKLFHPRGVRDNPGKYRKGPRGIEEYLGISLKRKICLFYQ